LIYWIDRSPFLFTFILIEANISVGLVHIVDDKIFSSLLFVLEQGKTTSTNFQQRPILESEIALRLYRGFYNLPYPLLNGAEICLEHPP